MTIDDTGDGETFPGLTFIHRASAATCVRETATENADATHRSPSTPMTPKLNFALETSDPAGPCRQPRNCDIHERSRELYSWTSQAPSFGHTTAWRVAQTCQHQCGLLHWFPLRCWCTTDISGTDIIGIDIVMGTGCLKFCILWVHA
jgi:hypothetical protein